VAVIEIQHVLGLVCHVKPKTFAHADVPGLPEFAVQTLLDAARTLLPLAHELQKQDGAAERKEAGSGHFGEQVHRGGRTARLHANR
jgi:hypothetical protein